jgi:tetratricopeptide (TPR) repeat protein
MKEETRALAINIVQGIGAGVVIVALIGLGMWFLGARKESEWRALRQEAQKAYAKEELLVAEDKFKAATKMARETWGDEDPRYINTLKSLAWVKNAQGHYNDGREIFKKVYKLSPEELRAVKTAQVALSGEMPSTMRYGPEGWMSKSADTIEKFLGQNDPELVPLLTGMAGIYTHQQKYDLAETQLLKVLSIAKPKATNPKASPAPTAC